MTLNRKLLLLAAVCVVLAGTIYVIAYWREGQNVPVVEQPANVATSTTPAIADGAYTVEMRSITTTADASTITFTPVSYLEGNDAKEAAAKDVPCDGYPIASCVPSLTRGYYVSAAGAPDLTVPVASTTAVVLKDNPSASIANLRSLARDLAPVFDIVIKDGVLISITERSPLPDTKG